LQDEIDDIENKLKKAVPESSTEALLLKIARKAFTSLVADPDRSDFDCFLFKYRIGGGPWRLVWCWGYQRTDMQPCYPLICKNPECNILFVGRPKTKKRCPRCQVLSDVKKPGIVHQLRKFAVPLLLLLLLLLGWLGYMNRPRLVVEPGQWAGPPGSRQEFKVAHKAWFFWNTDVTDRVMAQSSDTRVLEFQQGTMGRAKTMGRATATFMFGNLVSPAIPITVGPMDPPDRIRIDLVEPEVAREDMPALAIGGTQLMRVMGEYDDTSKAAIDITELIDWEVDDEGVAFVHGARVEGKSEGDTKVRASYLLEAGERLTDMLDVEVIEVDFEAISVTLTPDELAISQHGKMSIYALDRDEREYCVTGSTLLTMETDSEIEALTNDDRALLKGKVADDDHVIGLRPGEDVLRGSFVDPVDKTKLVDKFDFVVGNWGLTDGFIVEPPNLDLFVDETYTLNVITPSLLDIEAVSGDESIVVAVSSMEGGMPVLTGMSEGETTVTVRQGDENETTINVVVTKADIQRLRIEPEMISLKVDEVKPIRVIGITADNYELDLTPKRLRWIKQPSSEFVYFDREYMEAVGQRLTTQPQELIVQLQGDTPLEARAEIQVVGNEALAGLIGIEDFGAHPPIPVGPGGGVVLDALGSGRVVRNGMLVDSLGDGSAFTGLLPAGSTITSIGGRSLVGVDPNMVGRYFTPDMLARGTSFTYLGPDGVAHVGTIGNWRGVARSLVELNADTSNVSDSSFSANITLTVRETAEYRITDAGGGVLSDWQTIGAGQSAVIPIASIPRSGGGMTSRVFVEQNGANGVVRIPYQIVLTRE